jgi:hypothetical protein
MERVRLGPYVKPMPEPEVNLVTLVTVRPWLDAAVRQSADSGSAAGGGFARQRVSRARPSYRFAKKCRPWVAGVTPNMSRLIRSPALALLVEARPPGASRP